MVTNERLEHPAGVLRLAIAELDFGMPTAELAQSQQTQGLGFNIKRSDTAAVLLVR
jgi:hypothetical protein